ncbi:MAG: DedA family protein [Acidobacteriota bacterium]
MHDTLIYLLHNYGYTTLFLLICLESMGIPLPGEAALVTASAFAASGDLSITWVVVTAAAAAIIGDGCGYWIGRKGGLPLIRRYGRYIRVDEAEIEKAHHFFQRYGAKTVFFGRFVALLRTWAAVLAGISSMPYSEFTTYNALGGITWAAVFGSLGYYFGQNLPQLEAYLGRTTIIIAVLVGVVGAGWAVRWFMARSHRRSKK